jgi:hypothetical protein
VGERLELRWPKAGERQLWLVSAEHERCVNIIEYDLNYLFRSAGTDGYVIQYVLRDNIYTRAICRWESNK